MKNNMFGLIKSNTSYKNVSLSIYNLFIVYLAPTLALAKGKETTILTATSTRTLTNSEIGESADTASVQSSMSTNTATLLPDEYFQPVGLAERSHGADGYTLSDHRLSAIGIGSVGIAVLVTIIATLILLDLPTLVKQSTWCRKRNVKPTI